MNTYIKSSKLLLVLLLLKYDLINSYDLIYMSFNSSNKPDYNYMYSFIDDLATRNLYTIMNIGDPASKLKTLFSSQNEYFRLIPNKKANQNNTDMKYDYTKSKTFKNITCLNEYIFESRSDILAHEKFSIKAINYQNNINKEIILDDFNMILGVNSKYQSNEYYISLGLKMIMEYKNLNKKEFNFIYQLKEKKIINSYYFCFFFEKGINENGIYLYNPDELFNANGELIIGDLPSNYMPNKYHKNQLFSTYSYDKDLINSWGLEFSSIYHYNRKNQTVKDPYFSVYFDFNNHLVQAPKSYYYQIKSEFFKDYLSKKICNIYKGNGFEAIYCNKSENFKINNLYEFPVLYLKSNELQYTFKFTYQDLFVEKDNRYWFLITFPIYYEVEEWYFGIIFLRKYTLIFNTDAKTISFYNPNIPIEEEGDNNNIYIKKNNKKIMIIIICIIILCLIFIGLGVLIAKILYYNKKTKKRYNELEDNFEYVSQEQKDNAYPSNSINA